MEADQLAFLGRQAQAEWFRSHCYEVQHLLQSTSRQREQNLVICVLKECQVVADKLYCGECEAEGPADES